MARGYQASGSRGSGNGNDAWWVSWALGGDAEPNEDGTRRDERVARDRDAKFGASDVLSCVFSLAGSMAWIVLSVVLVLFLLPGCRAIDDALPAMGSSGTRDTSPVLAGLYAGEPDIRVRIQAGVASVEIGAPSTVLVRQAGGNVGASAANVKPVLLTTPLRITSNTKGLTITDGSGASRSFGFGTNVEIVPGDGSADGFADDPNMSLQIGKTRYPGFALLRPRWSDNPTSIDVIVAMSVESYLPGVLTHELFKDWPRQTYEAQSIAARTYALHERQRARGESRGHDVEATDSDQVYGGAAKSTVALEATRATKGLVITDEGRLVRSYFSSCCGGRPASASVTWPMKPGFEFNSAECLQGKAREHACGKSRFYRWNVTRSDADVSQRVRAWGRKYDHAVRDMAGVREIAIAERNAGQRPNRFTLTDSLSNTYTLTGEELRSACNYAVHELPPISQETRIHSSDVEAEVWANQIRFSGRGWGHGVGMCQWCAKGFADMGWDYARMLREFYPGCKVEKAY